MTKPFHQFLDPNPLPDALGRPVVAIGNFDGIHLGHRALLNTALATAAISGSASAVLTFSPHPRRYFQPERALFPLTDAKTKARLLADAGIDALITLTFDAQLAAMPAQDFIDGVLVKRLRASSVVIGHDFHYGKQRLGTPEMLTSVGLKRGFTTQIVQPKMLNGDVVSSSRIRSLLSQGDIVGANQLLGREWCVESTVQHGEKRGRELGYPTANLHLDESVLLKYGIYAVRAVVEGISHPAIASFGSRPTFDDGAAKLEVHIFDFCGDLYGKTMTVYFAAYIRAEQKFSGIEPLIEQMDQDSRQARHLLAG
jgi:riboflavin kinase / FMN adenylyltransferase